MIQKTTKAALIREIREAEAKASAAGIQEVAVVFFEIGSTGKQTVRQVAMSRFAASFEEGHTGLVNKSGGLVKGLKNGFEDPTATHFVVRF
jgi:hypothetical protein